MAVPLVPQIVGNRIAGQKPSHEFGQSAAAAAQQYMGVVSQKRPGVNCRAGLYGKISEPGREPVAVLLIIDDPAPFYSPDDHVMQCPGYVQSRLSWHASSLCAVNSIYDSFCHVFMAVA